MANLIHGRVGETQVVVHSAEPPTDAEWDGFLEAVRARSFRVALVWTDGGAPTGDQRDRLKKALDGRDVPVAVVTDDKLSRAVLAVISLLFMKNTQAFGTQLVGEAMDFLRIPDSEQDAVTERLHKLRSDLAR